MPLYIMRPLLSLLAVVLAFSYVSAQEPATPSAEADEPTILDHINESGRNVIIADDNIIELLQPDRNAQADKKSTSTRRIEYRVQVFSDNKAEKSKQEAMAKERVIKRRFPDQATAIVYTSPYWRLHVGNFRSSAEAEELAAKLRKAFPSYSKEIHVVRARAASSK